MGEVSFLNKQLKFNTKEDAADVVKAIEECVDMETLVLSGNTCGVEACEAISSALKNKPSFKRAIWRDIFTGRLLEEIPPSLGHLGSGVMASNSRLTELDLSDNAFGPNGIKGAVELLSSPACFSLKTFTLNNVGLGIAGAKLLARSLLNCHQAAADAGQRFALEEFTSGRNRLENEGAKALAEVFEKLGSLVRVSMTQNGINYSGISALIKALAKNHNLQVLDLNDNTFTAKGAAAVAEALPLLGHLRVVNFGDCLLRSEGARVLATSLHDHLPELEVLDLSFNEINGDAALEVATSLTKKTNLKRLELNGNSIGESTIELLKQSMEAKGFDDILGALSDDEGSGDEDDDCDHGADSSDKSDDDEEYDDEDDSNKSLVEKALGVTIDQPLVASSASPTVASLVDSYWSDPSAERLLQLPAGQRADLVAARVMECGTTDSLELSGHFVMITGCCKMDAEQETKDAVFAVIDKTFGPHISDDFLFSFLQHVGLLKNEDKKFRPCSEKEGPIVAIAMLALCNRLSDKQLDLLRCFFFKEESFTNQQVGLKRYLQDIIKCK